jgi:hypothetical protein
MKIKRWQQNHLILFSWVTLMGFLLNTAGCNEPSQHPTASKQLAYEVQGTATERINTISALIAKSKPLPSELLDAQFLQEKLGDGAFGPADFNSFYVLKINPQDLPKWLQVLSPSSHVVSYVEPTQMRSWWVSAEQFANLKFFEPEGLMGNSNGWLGIDEQAALIYISTFTT